MAVLIFIKIDARVSDSCSSHDVAANWVVVETITAAMLVILK